MNDTSNVSSFPMEIGRVQKTKKDVYIVSINQFKGKMYIDVRLHYFVDNGQIETRPTKKGITLNLRTFEPMARLLIDAYKALEELQKNTEVKEELSEEG